MKTFIFSLFLVFSQLAFGDGGRCLPGADTPSYQAPFCKIVTDSQRHCEVVGCEWVYQSYRCVAGPDTPDYQAAFCKIVTDGRQHCELIGCEWILQNR